MKSIVVLVTPDGQTSVETKGFKGPACQEASRFLELALGQRQSEQLTSEFHQTVSTEQQRRQQM